MPAVDNPLATHTKLWALAVSDEGNKDNLNAEYGQPTRRPRLLPFWIAPQ